MTTIDALKNLYVELGGNLEDVENINVIPKMIDALSEIAGSTIELPGVTAEDNGDVLTVVDGKWAKAEAGGGASLPGVTAEDNGDVLTVVDGAWAKAKPTIEFALYKGVIQSNTFTLSDSKNKSDILADITAGKHVELFDNFNKNYYRLTRNNGGELIFECLYYGTELNFMQIVFSGGSSSTTGAVTTTKYTPAQ